MAQLAISEGLTNLIQEQNKVAAAIDSFREYIVDRDGDAPREWQTAMKTLEDGFAALTNVTTEKVRRELYPWL